jgi:hypothetical protein
VHRQGRVVTDFDDVADGEGERESPASFAGFPFERAHPSTASRSGHTVATHRHG